MRSIRSLTVLAGLLTVGSCKSLDVEDLNFPSVDQLGPDASVAAIRTAVQGLVSVPRIGIIGAGSASATASALAGYGRETVTLNTTGTGDITTYVSIDLDAWYDPWLSTYKTMAQANVILKSLPSVAGFTTAQREGIAGFIQTIKAVVLFQVIRATDQAGASPDAPDDPLGSLPPIQSKAQTYQRVVDLLDSAQTHLQAGGATFAFTLPPGFTGLSTPLSFLSFNRGFKARMDVFMGNHTQALTDLAASFINSNPGASMTTGAYWDYSSNSGDIPNPLFDPLDLAASARLRFAHPSIWAGAQLKLDGSRDNRALAKVEPITSVTKLGFTVTEKTKVYNTPSAPIPILRNEELILLRAEANLSLGNRAAALTDINYIRQNSGGLAAIADPGDPGLLNELLYNRLYSLYFEQGVRWFDARRYGRLAQLPHDRTGDVVFQNVPIPRFECTQRPDPKPAGCTATAGL